MTADPSHFELGVPDARRAKTFDGQLLGWSFTPTSGENAWIGTGGRYVWCRDDQRVEFELHEPS